MNFGCWYVQTTGIWKTVWTEYVPKIRLDHVKMTPNLHDMALELEYQLDVPESELNENLMVVATITFGDMLISKTMTVMTSDHMKTKVVLPQNKQPGQLWYGVGRKNLESGEPGSLRHHI